MPIAIARFVELLRLTCPDLVVHDGMVDAQSAAPAARRPSSTVRVAKVNALLGTALSERARSSSLIEPIGFAVERTATR